MNRSYIRFGFLSLVLAAVMTLAATVSAQEFRATITGTVTDPNGSAIPGATVVVRNTATNIATTVKTNDDGSYTVPFLIPGKYSVSATGDGFKTSVRENLELEVDNRLTIDFQLSIGTQAEVDVVANDDLIERGSVTTGTVITNRQIEELPLPEGAVTTLVTQAPGVNYTGNPQFTGPTANGNLAAFRTNGAAGNIINLDGSPNLAFNGQVAFTPPADAVQEFKVQTNSFDAQNGYTAGSTVNTALKSGTNQFHGSLYYFNRDQSRTANNFFSNRAGLTQPPREYYRTGGQVNGPIFKNKTFFLFAMERQRDNIAEPTTFRVPTALQRQGNFSELLPSTIIYDPNTAFLANSTCGNTGTLNTVCRLPFAGNIIPADRLNAAAVRYLNLFPAATQVTNGIGTFASNMNLIRPYESYLGKIDHNFNSNHKIFGRYYFAKSEEDRYNWIGTPDAPTRGFETRINKGANLDYTATLNASMIFNIRSSWNLFSQERRNANPISPQSLGFSAQALAAFRGATVIPRFDFASFNTASIAGALGSLRADYNEGLFRPFQLFSIQPTFTQIWKNHTFRYGYDYRRLMERNETLGFRSGRFQFDGTYTTQASNAAAALRNTYGRDLAAFLLGLPTASGSSFIDNPAFSDANQSYHGFFFQDDWRVNQKLSINWGLRYEWEGGAREAQGRIVTGFDTTSANPLRAAALANFNAIVPAGVPIDRIANLSGGLLFASDANQPAQQADINNWQPRFGISYQLDEKTVIRAGFGMFTAPFQIPAINQASFATPTLFVPSNDNGLTFIANLNNPFPTGILPSPGSSQGLGTFIGRDLSVLGNDRQNATFYRWIVGFQRQLPGRLGLEVTYINSQGRNLQVDRPLNFVPSIYLNSGLEFDATINSFLTANVANPFRGLVPTNAAFNGANIARSRLLTQFPQFGNVNVTEFNGQSSFQSLQAQVIKRFTKGLSLNFSYTFSSEREATQRLNPQDAELTWQIAPSERPHRFTFSNVYELPIGRGRWVGKNWNRWLDAIVGGWQVQSNYEWQSGEPLIFGNVFYDLRAGDLRSLKSRAGKKDAQGRRYGVDIPAFDVTGFYPAGFVLNGAAAPASIGLGSSTLRYFPLTVDGLRNQRFLNFNAGMSKNFRIREGMKVQLRVEAINALNRPFFNTVSTNPTNTPNLSNPAANNLGRFGFTNGQRQPPRDIQIGARFTF